MATETTTGTVLTDSAASATSARRTRRLRLAVRYLVLIVAAAIILFPIYITVVDALLSPQQVVHRPPTLFPLSPHWANFSYAFKEGDLGIYLRNSAIVTLAVTAAELVTSVFAAYAFVFLRFPGRRVLFFASLATLMVPFEATIIPNYQTIQKFGLFNTYGCLLYTSRPWHRYRELRPTDQGLLSELACARRPISSIASSLVGEYLGRVLYLPTGEIAGTRWSNTEGTDTRRVPTSITRAPVQPSSGGLGRSGS